MYEVHASVYVCVYIDTCIFMCAYICAFSLSALVLGISGVLETPR